MRFLNSDSLGNLMHLLIFIFLGLFGSLQKTILFVHGLGTSCSSSLGAGTAAASDPYWLETIKHQGISAYNANPSSYQVFRNVKVLNILIEFVPNLILVSLQDFGAKGDGVTDDTAAIKTYLVSAPIVAYYYTQLIGDAKNPPTLLASSSFSGMAVIGMTDAHLPDANPYIPGGGGSQYYTNQNNLHLDGEWKVRAAFLGTGFMLTEHHSGGFMGDLVFNGGKYGMWVGNQHPADFVKVGFDIATGGTTTQTSGAVAIIDATVVNTPIFVRTSTASNGKLGGSLVINNAKLSNVTTAVGVLNGGVVLAGGTTTVASWGQGDVYSGTSSASTFTQGNIHAANKPSALLDSSGKIFGKMHPQYAAYATSQIVSVRDNGAKGDGKTDDTAALKAIFAQACSFCLSLPSIILA
ncbi:hypothetical protein H0H93_011274 [Arthromyces matolae]|nr:hypothetical protein H0H93_011274 [Arthromyces matolae]